MTTSVRRATLEDIAALVELMSDFYAESGFSLDKQWATTSFSTFLCDDSLGTAWIAFHNGEPAGYVVLTVRFSMEYGGLDAFVDDLFVLPACRRRGLAKALLGVLFLECGRRAVLAIHVEVGRDNSPAKALYHDYGFREGTDGRQMLTVRLGGVPGLAE